MKDFWLSCGHHLLDRDEHSRLRATDKFTKLYLARPELAPQPDAYVIERTLHAALLSDPWQPVAVTEIDANARENWQFIIAFETLATHRTLEATYTALVRENIGLPPMFLDQLVHLILRNALDQCDDTFMLRAAELFFRPQRVTVHDGGLLAADREQIDVDDAPLFRRSHQCSGCRPARRSRCSPMLTLQTIWEHSDRFDLALDLTSGRRGLAALGAVIMCWVKHMLISTSWSSRSTNYAMQRAHGMSASTPTARKLAMRSRMHRD